MNNNLQSFLEKCLKVQKPKYDNLALLTLVIPSYCRQDFVVRQCGYWHGSGVKVVIVDGSPQSLSAELLIVINSLEGIQYLHLPIKLIDRLSRAASLIQTPYTVLCGDDEFLLMSGLSSAIRLLEQKTDSVACIGQSLWYYLVDHNANYKCRYGVGYDTYKYQNSHEDPASRLKLAMENYNAATCYAVTRSEVWRKSWGNLQDCSCAYAWEIQHALCTYIWGKLSSIDEVYWMRSVECSPPTTSDYDRALVFNDWWFSEEYKTETDRFVDRIAEELILAKNYDRLSAKKLAREVVEIFVQDQLAKQISNHDLSFRQKFRKHFVEPIKACLPGLLVDYLVRLRKLFRRKPFRAPPLGNFGFLFDIQNIKTGTPFLLNDSLIDGLKEMEDILGDFYQTRQGQTK